MVCWALLLSANEKNESCVEAWAGVPSPAQDVLRASRRYTSNASSSRDGPKLSCVWLEELQDTAILQICLLFMALCWHLKKIFLKHYSENTTSIVVGNVYLENRTTFETQYRHIDNVYNILWVSEKMCVWVIWGIFFKMVNSLTCLTACRHLESRRGQPRILK